MCICNSSPRPTGDYEAERSMMAEMGRYHDNTQAVAVAMRKLTQQNIFLTFMDHESRNRSMIEVLLWL